MPLHLSWASDMETGAEISKKYRDDCFYLHCCFTGNGSSSDLKMVAEIFTHRNKQELRFIRRAYRAIYNRDLLHLLSQQSNLFSRVAYLLISEPNERDAELMRRALFGRRFDHEVLTEIICTRSSSELLYAQQEYQARYNTHVSRDISSKAKGSLKEVLLAILNSSNQAEARVNMSMAMCHAKTLYEAIESGKIIDQRSIISVLSQQSTSQIRAILSSYKQLYGHEFMKFLKKEKCGEFGKQLRVIIRCIQFPEKQFAKQLRRTLKNGDARDVLIRIVVTRSEIDIKHINNAFAMKTGWSLESLVRTEFNNSSSSESSKSNGLVGDVLISLLKSS